MAADFRIQNNISCYLSLGRFGLLNEKVCHVYCVWNCSWHSLLRRMFKKLRNFNVVIMADIFATDVCKSALISFSTTICPHGWNNFSAVEWIFITTNYVCL